MLFIFTLLGYKFVDPFLSVIVTMNRYTWITKFFGKIAVAQREITITVCWVETEEIQRDKILEAVLGYVKISWARCKPTSYLYARHFTFTVLHLIWSSIPLGLWLHPSLLQTFLFPSQVSVIQLVPFLSGFLSSSWFVCCTIPTKCSWGVMHDDHEHYCMHR